MQPATKEHKISFLENVFTKKGTVLAVRSWEPATFYEIDLHLPETDMRKWNDTQHIKCKVAALTYRDYTPAYWDADTNTCTMYIDAAHDGTGSRWAKSLQPGDPFYYLGSSSSHQKPVSGAQHVFLGDQSAAGHFAAMQQLAGDAMLISGAILVKDSRHQKDFKDYFPSLAVQPLLQKGDAADVMTSWLQQLRCSNDAIFYLAGNIPMVTAVRKMLRRKGLGNQQVRAQGFWH